MNGPRLRRGPRKARPVRIYEWDWSDDEEFQAYFDLSVANDDIRHVLFEAAENPDAAKPAQA